MPNHSKLQINKVSKVFSSGFLFKKKHLKAVNEVNFTLNKGDTLAIVGESGSGKSTIARLITHLISLTKGEILFEGENIENLAKELPEKVQMIFQDPFAALNPSHTIGYIIEKPLKIRKKTKRSLREKVLELLTLVGLTPATDFIDKYPHQLSGGQKQRVVIAKVLGLEPEVIIADEPTSMLDVSIGVDIMNLLLDLKKEKDLSYIIITHNLGDARYMAERILVMYAGQIVEIGEVEEVINSPKHPYTRLLLESSPDPWDPDKESIAIIPEDGSIPHKGCKFQNRCPFVMEQCKNNPVPIYDIGDGQEVRCELYKEGNLKEEDKLW